jgi:hypothetical protein
MAAARTIAADHQSIVNHQAGDPSSRASDAVVATIAVAAYFNECCDDTVKQALII